MCMRWGNQPAIKLVLPYDGDRYFTRQAYRDVVGARHGGLVSPTKLSSGSSRLPAMRRPASRDRLAYMPIMALSRSGCVSLPPPGAGEADQLLADSSACVISQKYQPEVPRIVPVHIDIELDDPDTAETTDIARSRRLGVDGVSDVVARQVARVKVIERSPERQLDFDPDLWLRVTVRLHLPRIQVDGVDAEVSKVFMSWPTHTSLRSLKLHAGGNVQLRYNPEQEHEGRKGGLEWSGVPMTLEGAAPTAGETHISYSSEDEIVTLSSGEMLLSISKPGELYKQENLSGRVEVAVNRLLSGMDARLYDVTGKQCQPRRPGLKLKSIVTTEFSLPLYDAFARRTMSPYQWLYFDEVIPSEMRIDDIAMALRNRGFRVVVAPHQRQSGELPDNGGSRARAGLSAARLVCHGRAIQGAARTKRSRRHDVPDLG